MRKQLAALATALTLAAAPAFAGEHSNHWNGGGWHEGYHHGGHWRGYGNNWAWPLIGGLAGATIIGTALAAPYYGYGGYGYAPYYTYPTQLVPAPTRWCQNPYGGWFLC